MNPLSIPFTFMLGFVVGLLGNLALVCTIYLLMLWKGRR